MKVQLTGIVVAVAALALTASTSSAQYGPVHPAGGSGPMFVDPAVTYAGCDACDAYGNPVNPGVPGGCYRDAGGGYGASEGYDQCGPHYFDLSVDALYLRRDRSAEPSVATTSLGISGPTVLSTSDAKLDYEPGFRITGRLDLGPNSLIETSYFGTLNHYKGVEYADNGQQLYSIFSNFGNGPLVSEIDQADLHRIEYASELNNVEINYRTYWVGNDPRLSGTFLIGARYTRLTEDFVFRSRVNGPPEGVLDYYVSTDNDLLGFQVGGDASVCLLQGLRLVGEGKIGIFNNRTKQRTTVSATSILFDLSEAADDNNVALIGEGGVMVVADILPSFSFRAGYQVLYLQSVALAGNNFSAELPSTIGSRTPVIDDQGKVLYHGFLAGFEYIW